MPIARRDAPLIVVLLLAAPARAADPYDWSFPLSVGMNVYTHRFAAEGKPALDTTPADSAQLSMFPGAGVSLSNRWRVGLNLQLTTALTNPPNGERFVLFALLPQVNYNFWGPLTVSLVPSFATRLAGQNRFAFYLQGVFAAALPLGNGFSGVLAVEVPVFFFPYVSIGITPLVGFSCLVEVHQRS